MKKGLIALAVASCVASVNASAELSYNYVEGGLAFYPSADNDQSFMGVFGRGSMEITPEFFGFGGIKFLTDDIDYTSFHAGAGYKLPIDDRIDVWGGASLEYQKVEADVPRVCFDGFGCVGGGSVSDNDTSFALRGGMRMEVNQQLEVAGSARYVLGDYDYLGLAGTARYKLQENLVLLGEVDLFDGDIGVLGGVTLFF